MQQKMLGLMLVSSYRLTPAFLFDAEAGPLAESPVARSQQAA